MATKPRPQAHAMPESATWPCATRAHLPARLMARSAGASAAIYERPFAVVPAKAGIPFTSFDSWATVVLISTIKGKRGPRFRGDDGPAFSLKLRAGLPD